MSDARSSSLFSRHTAAYRAWFDKEWRSGLAAALLMAQVLLVTMLALKTRHMRREHNIKKLEARADRVQARAQRKIDRKQRQIDRIGEARDLEVGRIQERVSCLKTRSDDCVSPADAFWTTSSGSPRP